MCLSVWLHVARLHPQQGPVLGGRRGGKGEASVGRRGGADELWSPALVAAGGFGHRAGAGQDGRSGPRLGCAWARRRLRGPRAPAGPEALGSERLGEVGEGLGRGGGPRAGWCLEGPRVGERQDLGAPHSTLPATPPGRHTRPAAPGPGSPVVPRAGPAVCWPWGGRGAGAGAGRGRRVPAPGPPGVRSRVVQLKCSARSVESWRAAAAGGPGRQVRAKGRRSAGLLGRLAAAASVYGHTTLNAPDLV